jgi:hypothetical protein
VRAGDPSARAVYKKGFSGIQKGTYHGVFEISGKFALMQIYVVVI